MDLQADRRGAGRIATLALGIATAAFILLTAGAASAASATSDMSVTLTNKTAKPGKRVSYEIVVHNAGPSTAQRVQAEFLTSTPLTSIKYSISTAANGGHCYRSSKETACLFGTMKAGQTAHVTISGILPKKLAKGTAVTNKVTVLANSKLINTANDVATDNYQIGVPKAQPLVASPSPSVNPDSKVAKITTAATHAIDFTHKALLASIVVLGAAALWFAIGLTLRHRARRRRRRAAPAED